MYVHVRLCVHVCTFVYVCFVCVCSMCMSVYVSNYFLYPPLFISMGKFRFFPALSHTKGRCRAYFHQTSMEARPQQHCTLLSVLITLFFESCINNIIGNNHLKSSHYILLKQQSFFWSLYKFPCELYSSGVRKPYRKFIQINQFVFGWRCITYIYRSHAEDPIFLKKTGNEKWSPALYSPFTVENLFTTTETFLKNEMNKLLKNAAIKRDKTISGR